MAEDIFTPRGICEKVREARGYFEYRAGCPEDVTAVARELARHPQWLALFTQVDGWTMLKHPVLPRMPGIRPQLRPDEAVVKKIWFHWHDGMSEHELEKHLDSKKRKPEHIGVGLTKLHAHLDKAKYGFAPPASFEFWGYKLHQDDTIRLDANPVTDFDHPGRVFFGIEGSLKNDAIASRGEKVFNVPGVSMWGAPELPLFALLHLLRGPVFIVPDSDWNIKTEVIFHATSCREYLRSLGVEAYIAAPPPTEELGAPEKDKGVDDYLGVYGGTLDDLRVLQRDVDEGTFAEWEDEYRRSARGRDGKRSWGRAAVGLDIKIAHAIALSSRAGESLRSAEAITGAIRKPGRLSEAEARTLAHGRFYVAREQAKEWPELAHGRGIHAWEKATHDVHKSLKRLQERGVFEATGILPGWRKARWEYDKGGKRRRYGAGPEGSYGELVRLDERLRVVEGQSVSVREVCEQG